jgi:hypothetical protein
MSPEAGQPSLRRSGRQRKDITYNKIGKLSNSPSPESSEELDAEFVQKPLLRRSRGRPRKDDDNIYLESRRRKKYESLSSVPAETDSESQAGLSKRMNKWKHILSEVPEELLNYSIGWGRCTGDWGNKGGERQKAKFLEQKLTPQRNSLKLIGKRTNTFWRRSIRLPLKLDRTALRRL